MRKIFLISILALLCAIAIIGFPRSKVTAKDLSNPEEVSGKDIPKSEAKLRSAMKTLWESRAILLRAYIVSAMNDSKDAAEAKDNLIKNAGDLGNSIKPYYGGLASGMLAGFLKKDVSLTEKVIETAKAGDKEALDLAKKAKEEALDLTKKAKEEALNLTEKAKEEALDLTKKAKEDPSGGLMEKSKEESTDVARKANTEALGLTEKAKEEALNLTEKAKEIAIKLTQKDNEEPLYLTEKAKGDALNLTEKAKGKATDLTERAKEKALVLTEEGNKETTELVNKDKDKAMGLIEKARGIAMDLIKKANAMALDITEKARIRALVRAKKVREEALEIAKRRWYGNARDLAGFFAIPHNQTKKDLTDMLYKHLDLTWGEIQSIIENDKIKDLGYYEKDRAHMLMFSDVLVDGLIKQFPEKFKE